MPVKAFKYILILLIVQCASLVATAGPRLGLTRQDSIRRVAITIRAKEIPPVVDYDKIFQQASPVEQKRKPLYAKTRRTATAHAASKASFAENKNTSLRSNRVVATVPKKAVPVVSAPVEKAPATTFKPLAKASVENKPSTAKALTASKPLAKNPVENKPLAKAMVANKPLIKTAAQNKSQAKGLVEKPASLAAKPAANKETTVQKPLLANKPAIKASATAAKRPVKKDAEKDRTLVANNKSLGDRIEESSTLVAKDINARANAVPEGENEYKQSINAEQERWDALADSQLKGESDPIVEDDTAASKMSYLYIGFALTVIGVILGLVFGRPAFLVSVVGVVFVVIGLFIRA